MNNSDHRKRRLDMGIGVLMVGLAWFMPQTQAQDSTADQQFLFAYRLLQKNERAMAAEALDEYLVEHPNAQRAGDARYYRALLYQQTGNTQNAIALLEDAPKPTLLPPWRFTLLHAQTLAQAGESIRAIAVIESIDLSGLETIDQAQIQFETGTLYQARNNLPKAIQAFEKSAARETPLQARAKLALGQAQIRLGLNEEALASLNQAASLADESIAPFAGRLAGDHARTLGDWLGARTSYLNTLNRFPDSDHAGPAAIGAMTCSTQLAEPKQVVALYEAWYTKIVEAQRPTADYLAGVAYSQLNSPEPSIQALERILDLLQPYPPGDAVLLLLAQNYAATQQQAKTQQTADRLTALFPDSPRRTEAGFLKASAELAEGEQANGIQTLSGLIGSNLSMPQRSRALIQRAGALETLGQTQAAIDDYLAYFEASPVIDDQPTTAQSAAMIRLMHLAYVDKQWPLIIGLANKWTKQYVLTPATEENLLYRLGIAAYAGHESENAAWAMQQLLNKHPDTTHSPQAAFYQGLAQLKLKNIAAGSASLERALATTSLAAPQALRARRLLVSVYAADDLDQQAAKHLRDIERAAGVTALSPQDWLWLGQHEQTHHRFAEAIACYQTAVENESLAANLKAFSLYQQALCQQALGAWNQSVAPLNAVIELNAGYRLEAKRARAEALRQQEQFAAALDAYSELWSCRVAIVEAEAFYQSAWIHNQTQRPEEAIRLLLRLTLLYGEPKMSPWPEKGYRLLQEIYTEQGQTIKAEQTQIEFRDKFPDTQ